MQDDALGLSSAVWISQFTTTWTQRWQLEQTMLLAQKHKMDTWRLIYNVLFVMEKLPSEVQHHIMHLKAMKSERQSYIKLSSF